MEESPSSDLCPLHGDCIWQFLYNSKFKDYNLQIFECKKCKFQSVHPQNKNWRDYYKEDYYSGNSDYSYIDERKKFKFHSYTWDSRMNIIQKQWKKYFPHTRFRGLRFLEVGSSFGGFLSRVKALGHSVYGVEVSETSAKYSIDNGIPCFIGTLEEADLPKECYDIIVLNEVIEHLPDPKKSLDILVQLMSKNSILVIQTANFEGWQAVKEASSYHYYLPGHLFYYGENILKKALIMRGISRFKIFYGSDVSLISKLRKMRGNFKKPKDYFKMWNTIKYHFKSKLKKDGRPLTSGFVLYAFKGGRD